MEDADPNLNLYSKIPLYENGDAFNVSATGFNYEEASYIFKWKNKYWLITDPHKGLAVYSSESGQSWHFESFILNESGVLKYDHSRGRHSS